MPTQSPITERMISEYCRKRVAAHLPPAQTEALTKFLIDTVASGLAAPRHAGKYDWPAMGMLTGVPTDVFAAAAKHIVPLLDAIGRSAADAEKRNGKSDAAERAANAERRFIPPSRSSKVSDQADLVLTGVRGQNSEAAAPKAKRQYTRRPIVEFPPPLWTEWDDVDGFADALSLHIKRHGDSVRHLFHAIAKNDKATNQRTLMRWASGELVPRSIQSLEVLARIERRYRLPDGYFKNKLPYLGRARDREACS